MKKSLNPFTSLALLVLLYATAFTLFECGAAEKKEVTIIGTWGGTELDNFLAVCGESGVKVKFETTRDLDAVIKTRLAAGSQPDVAVLPNPAKLKELAKTGKIKDLGFLDEQALLKDYARAWLDLASYGGKLYGIFYKAANKSVIWYNPKEFEKNGWKVPTTWDDLVDLTKTIAKSGKKPWSIGADIGWPLSDWIENIMVRVAGPRMYQEWIDHEIPWTDGSVRQAFAEWKKIVGDPSNLYGGIDGTLATTFQNAAFAVFQDPPKAYMYYEGDFMGGIVSVELPNVKLGENMAFFPFPPINPEYKTPVVGGADVIVVFNDSASVKKLVSFLTTTKAHEIWVKRGGFISQNKNVSLDLYPDKITRASAEILANAEVYVFDASDLMPPAVGNQGGFWDACKKFIQKPSSIDTILGDMEKLAEKNY
jgi:alpha-glucoside transport system substrate-binding protein